MKRSGIGRAAGILGVLAVLFPWLGLTLVELNPNQEPFPFIGLRTILVIMFAGVLLTTVAALLHSKWWLLAVAGAIATFVFFAVGSLS